MCVCYYHLWVQCLVAGCRGSGCRQQAMRPGRGMLRDSSCNIPLSGLTASCPAPDLPTTNNQALQTIGVNNTYSLELLMMGVEVPETC